MKTILLLILFLLQLAATARAQVGVNLTHNLTRADIKSKATVTAEIGEIVPDEERSVRVALGQKGLIAKVEGAGIQAWSVGLEQGKEGQSDRRYLQLTVDEKFEGTQIEATVTFGPEKITFPTKLTLPSVGRGDALGLGVTQTIQFFKELEVDVLSHEGAEALQVKEPHRLVYASRGLAELEIQVALGAAAAPPVEIKEPKVTATLAEDRRSVEFSLDGTVVVQPDGVQKTLALLGGKLTLADVVPDLKFTNHRGYHLQYQKAGEYPLAVRWIVPVQVGEDTAVLMAETKLYNVLQGALDLKGWDQEVEFDRGQSVVPIWSEGGWQAFLPAGPQLKMVWKQASAEAGKLYFNSEGRTQLSASVEGIRQASEIGIQVLQGTLEKLTVEVTGKGTITEVSGVGLLRWNRTENGNLELTFSPDLTTRVLIIESEIPLTELPTTTEPLRFTPVGAVRHSGTLTLNQTPGTKLTLASQKGLIQVTGQESKKNRQSSETIYQFPSEKRSYQVRVEQIAPDISVAQRILYSHGAATRTITCDMEIQVKDAPVSELRCPLPAGFLVSRLESTLVSDHVVEDGMLRLLCKAEKGRFALRFELEQLKSAAKSWSAWTLPPLTFEDTRFLRGEIAVASAPGFRVEVKKQAGLDEIAVRSFTGFDQTPDAAFRLKKAEWSAETAVLTLPKDVQADLFHLCQLQDGRAKVSVLINYFVAGAPTKRWLLQVPEEAQNIEVAGLAVRDSLRKGTSLEVPLHQEVMGPYQLLVTYERPAEKSLSLIELVPQEANGVRGYVQVVSDAAAAVGELSEGKNLLPVAPGELPAEYQLLVQQRPLATYQYVVSPAGGTLPVKWLEEGRIDSQLVEFTRVSSQLSQDGGVITEAEFSLRTRQVRSVRLMVPELLAVQEVRVNEDVVVAREDGNMLIVPVQQASQGGEPVTITVRASQAPTGEDEFALQTPWVLGLPQLALEWMVKAGAGGSLTITDAGLFGKMEESRDSGVIFQLLMVLAVAVVGALMMITKRKLIFWVGVLVVLAAIVWSAQMCLNPTNLHAAGGASYPERTFYLPVVGEVDAPQLLGTRKQETVTDRTEQALLIGGLGLVLLFVRRLRLAGAAVLVLATIVPDGSVGPLTFAMVAGGLSWFALITAVGRRGMTTLLTAGLFITTTQHGEAETAIPQAPQLRRTLLALQVQYPSSIEENWTLDARQLASEGTVELHGQPGDQFAFLRSPAVVAALDVTEGGMKLTKTASGYSLVLTDGEKAVAKFRYRVAREGGESSVPVLTEPAAVRKVTVRSEAEGWLVDSANAVKREKLAEKGVSGAMLWLAGDPNATVTLTPDTSGKDEAQLAFSANTQGLFVARPGVVEGLFQVSLQVTAGVLNQVKLAIPAGFSVVQVAKHQGGWSFDPESQVLTLDRLETTGGQAVVEVKTQATMPKLPADWKWSLPVLPAAKRQQGVLMVASAPSLELARLKTEGMFGINTIGLSVPDGVSVEKAWRTTSPEAALAVQVRSVETELRLTGSHQLSFGIDRLTLSARLNVMVARAPVYEVELTLPDSFDLVTLEGAEMDYFRQEDQKVTVFLKKAHLGELRLQAVLSRQTPELPQKALAFPRLQVTGATRESGTISVVPGPGIQLEVGKRSGLSPLVRDGRSAMQPGSLSFRVLMTPWELTFSALRQDPSVAARVLQEVTVREGRQAVRIEIAAEVTQAQVRFLELNLPGLDEAARKTLRVEGRQTKAVVLVKGDLFRVELEAPVIGSLKVRLDYETASTTLTPVLALPVVAGARSQESYLALRLPAQLEVEKEDRQGISKVDWSTVPRDLVPADLQETPAAAYKSDAQSGGRLTLTLARHETVDGLAVRVEKAAFQSIIGLDGRVMNKAQLSLQAFRATRLPIAFPPDAIVFGVFVNDQPVTLIKENGRFLVPIEDPEENSSAVKLEMSFLSKLDGGRLQAVGLSQALENVTWTVKLPEGESYEFAEGDLTVRERNYLRNIKGGRGSSSYQADVAAEVESVKSSDIELLNKAGEMAEKGLNRAALNSLETVVQRANLSASADEDARIQYDNLLTQQAEVAFNTRRQVTITANAFDASELQQVVENPVLNGELDFQEKDLRRLRQANGADVNASLTELSDLWRKNQPDRLRPGTMLAPVLPTAGDSIEFNRDVYLATDKPLSLTFRTVTPVAAEARELGMTPVWALLGALATIGLFVPKKKK